MLRWLVTMLGLLCCMALHAQTLVTGNVIDKASRKPVEYASVLLIQLPDSVSGKGGVTDKRGKFSLENVQPGTYVLQCSFIGFGSMETTAFTITEGLQQFTIPTIELLNAGKSLSDVIVTGRKSTLNTAIDRKVYNVEQDIMSRAGSVSDILRNIPSVEVDIDGNVNLRGTGEVIILINGKPSPLMGRTRGEVLQQLPANSIERIEVITNPSARYRPDGSAGIINIVLKKNFRNGFNGSVTANAGNRDRYNGNVSLNYKPGKMNLFGSYSYRQDSRRRYNNIYRTYIDSLTGDPEGYFNQSVYSLMRVRAHIVNAGIDYNINEKNSMGASGTYFYRNRSGGDEMQNFYFDEHSTLTERFNRLQQSPELEQQTNGAFYFEHLFNKEDHQLRAELNTSSEKETENNQFTNVYFIPARPASLDNIRISEKTDQNQLTIDYANPLSEDSKLEAGFDGLYTKTDLDFNNEYYDQSRFVFVKDTEKSNRFVYNENMHAVYGTYQKSYEKFGFSLGLRAEGVFTKGRLLSEQADSLVRNDYFKIYPTVHLSYAVADQQELQLNYSKRVNRPEADELNPFPEYQDPRNLRAGNPRLLPEIIHSVEFGYKWSNSNFSVVPSIYYRYKQNGFTSVIRPLNDSVLLTTEENLLNDQSAGLELIFSAKNGKWFTLNLNTNVFYNRIDASNLGFWENRSVFSMSSNLNSNFTVTKTTMLQLSANYRSARLTPQGRLYPFAMLNAGIRQDLFRNKLSVTLTASDVFNSFRQKRKLNTIYLQQETINRRDGRIIYLGISYRFGVSKKEKEEPLQIDEGL
jgi:outer membrane receptor protein involved in Fe transport